jgi:arylsulfatase A-like enzyme
VFEGGIRVPLVVKGPLVLEPGREVAGLVNTVDLFATLAELAMVDLSSAPVGTLDSISLVPYLQDPSQQSLRETAFAETFTPNGLSPTWSQRALRNARFKLIASTGAPDSFYDLGTDPYEAQPLDPSALGPLARQNYLDLKQRLSDLLASP